MEKIITWVIEVGEDKGETKAVRVWRMSKRREGKKS